MTNAATIAVMMGKMVFVKRLLTAKVNGLILYSFLLDCFIPSFPPLFNMRGEEFIPKELFQQRQTAFIFGTI